MIVRSYSGRTVDEALAKVRADLGEHALIIETRTVREPGLLGIKVGYEVVAARDNADSIQRTAAPAAEPAINTWQPRELAGSPVVGQTAAVLPGQAAGLRRQSEAGAPALPSAGLEEELATIRRQLTRLAAGQGTPVGHLGEELSSRLEDGELPAEIIAELDDACRRAGERLGADRREDFLIACMARSLSTISPMDWGACRRLMLVGATGVGKTTTIAKLAGELALRRHKSLALITIDTYRVAAQDQLTAYANLLDVPCEVATTPAQLARALERFAGCDHVLIDTAGRSPADTTRVHELKGFCRAAPGISIALCAAATAGRAEFAAVVERFSVLPIEHAFITKVDECQAPGRLYGCLRRHRLPVRYVTTGQEVPDDIEVADALAFARRVVQGAQALAA